MNLRSSFIFSSERNKRKLLFETLSVLAWIFVGLVAIDVAINLLLPYPQDPQNLKPSPLQLYFDYGRSVEGKLNRMTRIDDPGKSAPMTKFGWYGSDRLWKYPETRERDNLRRVSIYGMSHAKRLALALARVTKDTAIRAITAPGATANWAYGAFLRDRGRHNSDIEVLTLMSRNLPMVTAVSPATWNQDAPKPYTADRYYLTPEGLTAVPPLFETFEGYVSSKADPRKWAAYRAHLAEHDPFYSPFLFNESILDQSAIVRLLRRAYGQRLNRIKRMNTLDHQGYNPQSEGIRLAHELVKVFAEQVREDGAEPVIFLVNNLGHADILYRAIKPVLVAHNIACLSSHTVASPNDPRLYLPDSHFIPSIDDELARRLHQMYNRTVVSRN
jgi:hypothetical protein